MSQTRIYVNGKATWQDDGPAYARRAGFGGAAIGHYQTTFTRPKRAAAGTVDPAAGHRSASEQRAVERKRAYRAYRARGLGLPA